MKRDSFVFYRSFFEAIEKLKKNDKLTVYSHLCKYALGEEVEELDGVPGAIFNLIKPQIDANYRRYENGMKGAEYGKLGGKPKTPKEPLTNPKETPNVNVNVNENVNDNVNVNVSGVPDDNTTTHIPLMADIRNEIAEKGYRLDGDSINRFIQYNREKGWKMNWKEALKKWAEKEQPNKSPAGKFANFPQRDDQEYRDLVNKVIKMNEGI